MSGQISYLAGLAAEDIVARKYRDSGYRLRETRWRGEAGEIDLIFEANSTFIFVEVKKSRDLAHAAQALRPRQIARIMAAGTEYCAGQPNGQLTDMRFDVALVDGTGRSEIIENALGH